jgi:hypothetical protein
MAFHNLKPSLSINGKTANALRACLLATLVAASIFPSQAQAPGDLRIALVIGNAAYAGKAALVNPGNDAQAMSETLRGLGFTVVEVRDGSKAQMQEAIAKVKASLQGKQAIGMLYYAGHGLQVDWRNYMVPIDAKMSKASEVPEQTVELGQVIDAFKAAGNRMNIVVLDACRDNPFEGTSSAKGLAQLDAPPGTFLAYATAPGNVAEDGDAKSSNGLYTQFLLQELKKPSAKIEDVFKRVRLNVRQKSEGRQIPWESTSLEQDFYFDAGGASKPQPSDGQAAFRIQRTIWESLKDSREPSDLVEFLKSFPSGYFSEVAQFRLDQINKPKIAMLPAQGSTTPPLLPGESPWRVGDTRTWREQAQEYPGRKVDFVNKSVITKFEGNAMYSQASFDGWGRPTSVPTISDLRGNPVSNPDIKFSVATQFLPAEYKVGNSWKFGLETETEAGNHFRDYQAKITAREVIKSAVGDTEVFRIEIFMQRSDGVQERSTSWMSPTALGTIKRERKLYNRGRLIYSSETDILSFTRSSS